MSTSTWLASSQHGEVVFVATIEGVKYCLTTAGGTCLSTATTGLNALYVADGYAGALSGMNVVGQYSQEISAFEPVATGSTVELVFSDLTGVLGPYLLAPRGAHRTYLTTPVDAKDTTAEAVTDGFAASGDVYIGREAIQYAGLDADSFNTLTRGAYSDARNSDVDRLGSDHDYVTTGDVTGPQLSPGVSSLPVVLSGRIVSIYAHQVTNGLPCSIADRAVLFRGYLDEVVRSPRGTLHFRVGHLQRVLDTQILRSQFVGRPSSTWTTTEPQQVTVGVENIVGDYEGSATIAAGTFAGWQGVLDALNTALTSLSGTVSGHKWSASTVTVGEETRVRIEFGVSTLLAAEAYAYVRLSPWLSGVLGFCEGTNEAFSDGAQPAPYDVQTIALAEWRPLLFASTSYCQMNVDRIAGRWTSQSTSRMPAGCASYVNGFLSNGKTTWQVQYISATNDVYTFTLDYALTDSGWGGSDDISALWLGREGDEVPELKQVWIERCGLGDWLYRTLVSTGVAGLNVTTYDDRAAQLGAGLAYSYVDAASFLGGEDPEVLVQVTGPTSIAKIINPLLAASGRYVVLDNGTLKLITLPWDSTLGTYQPLTAADYCGTGPDAYPEMAWGRDGVINRVKIKTGLPGLVRDTEVTVNDVSSMGDFGPQPGPTLEAPGLVDLRAWAEQIAEPMVSYFARGPQRLGLSVGWTCSQLVPGDRVSLTDVSMLDPVTGVAGVINMAAIVCSSIFDCASGKGRLELWYLAERALQGGYWAPSARVSTYAAGTPSITVDDHTYSASTEATDDADFGVGDVVTIHSIDASGALQTWDRTIAGIDHGTRIITLSAKCIGLDTSTRVYDVTYAAISSSVESQTAEHAYEADASGTSTGGADPDPYVWSPTQDNIVRAAPSDIGLTTMPTTIQGLAVPSNAAHLAAGVIDRITQKRMRSLIASTSLTTPYTMTPTTSTDLHLYWMSLPVWLPMHREAFSAITISAALTTSDADAVYMVTPYLCSHLPTGNGNTPGAYFMGRCIAVGAMEVEGAAYVAYSTDISTSSLGSGLWYLVLLAQQVTGTGDTLSMRDLSVWGS